MDNPTDFYDALAPMFDVMTDWDARLAVEGPFLAAVLAEAGARSVLDAACGSGGHAIWLARQGYRVAGADISPGMIALARQKADAAGLAVPFVIAGLDDLQPANVQPAQGFDAVFCLGNSLPHLLTQADLVAALRGMARVLRPGGVLVLQNLNYDLRWQKQPRWFMAQGGELDGQEVLVWRFADYDVPAGRIAFHIALFREATEVARSEDRPQQERGDRPQQERGDRPQQGKMRDWKATVHTTPQRPLFQADLVAGLADAGFVDVRAHGRMVLPAEPFDPKRSGDLVVIARKRN